MDEKKQFLSLLNIPKRKLLIEHFTRYVHSGLFLAVISTFIISLVARFFVVLHLNEIMMIVSGIILLTAVVIAFFKKPDNYDAAALFDDYVTEDRVTTALTYLQKDKTAWSQLQRRDALSYMKKLSPKIRERKLKLFFWKVIFTMLFLMCLTTISVFTPNDVMKIAEQQEIDEQITKESKEEIKKISVMKDKANEHLEELKKQTKDLKDSEVLLKKLMAKEASLDKEKKDGLHRKQQLENLAEEVKDFKELSDGLKKEDAEKINKALDQLMEKFADLTEQQQNTLENMISEATGKKVNNVAELTEEQIKELTASLEKQLDKLIESAQSINQLAMLQEQVKQLATSLNQNMTNAGLSHSNQLAFASQNPSNQNKGNSDQKQKGQTQKGNAKGQNPNESGQGKGNGGGSGSGKGSGNGSGTGSGSGSGSGGSGNGTGSGAGLGQGSRELTIPEKIDGKETVENDFGQLGEGNGEQQMAPEAPVLNGTVHSYEEVYGNYEHAYRESVERMDLPGYLEDVVKDYFSDLNPEGD